jgi:hypothetical protein
MFYILTDILRSRYYSKGISVWHSGCVRCMVAMEIDGFLVYCLHHSDYKRNDCFLSTARRKCERKLIILYNFMRYEPHPCA